MGYAACFDSAMNHVAPTLGLKPTKSSTTVGVGIGQKADGAFGLDLDITIAVAGLTEDEARKLITRAHEVCPYSNACISEIPYHSNKPPAAARIRPR